MRSASAEAQLFCAFLSTQKQTPFQVSSDCLTTSYGSTVVFFEGVPLVDGFPMLPMRLHENNPFISQGKHAAFSSMSFSCCSFLLCSFHMITFLFGSLLPKRSSFALFFLRKKDTFSGVFLIAWQRPTLTGGSPQLPSAQKSLTTVFGMGTGVTSLLLPPDLF